jgi:hypothetical protein
MNALTRPMEQNRIVRVHLLYVHRMSTMLLILLGRITGEPLQLNGLRQKY